MRIEPKTLLSDGEGIPTAPDHYFNYDYGARLNDKLRSLGWTPAQYDAFLDYLHQERDVCSLVADYLYHAPIEAIKQEADALGFLETE